MDLLSIVRKVWRYKLFTLPVVALTLFGVVYVVAVKEPVYEASSSYVLINPPLPPTTEEIMRDPELRHVNADNPYTRFSDQTVVVEVLSSSMSSQAAKDALLKRGADPRYEVSSGSAFGYSSPIVQITAQGASRGEAVRSAQLVDGALVRELDRMQRAKGVDREYWIQAQQLDAPDEAKLLASGQLRMLVGVLALGAVLLFVVVSVADALATLRKERLGRAGRVRVVPSEGPWHNGSGEWRNGHGEWRNGHGELHNGSAARHNGGAEALPALEQGGWRQSVEEPAAKGQLVVVSRVSNGPIPHVEQAEPRAEQAPSKDRLYRRWKRRLLG